MVTMAFAQRPLTRMKEDSRKQSSASFQRPSCHPAKVIKRTDDRIDALEMEIDAMVVELLALHQPMASDLRQIIASNKVANDLERVGDHGVSMAKAAKRLAKATPVPELRELTEMVAITKEMLSDALASYVTRNSTEARMVCAP